MEPGRVGVVLAWLAIIVFVAGTDRLTRHYFRADAAAGTPPAPDQQNVYSGAGAGRLNSVTASVPARVYVPNIHSGDIYVIDPKSLKVVDRFPVGRNPQHVVPSWDLKTLWVTESAQNKRAFGGLTPIDPWTGKPGPRIEVPDAYNMYFTPDGRSAIVVAEAQRRLEFRDPKSMALQSTLSVPGCRGINHADFAIGGRYAVFTCEFGGSLAEIDITKRTTSGYLKLPGKSMPQDIRISPDGKIFYVADMMADGVHKIDSQSFKLVGFIPTGVGTHGLYPSRDGRKLYVANRGTHLVHGHPHGPGSISVLDFNTERVERTWPVPGGGSPDMGNVSADGNYLWLSGRFDDVVYVIDTRTGEMKKIPVGIEPHGLTVWPQPGRYSLGHTGNMR
jgi:YVTN family beta-propeller protein